MKIIPPTYLNAPKNSMWYNDIHHGDCVTVEKVFAKSCHNPEIFITGDEVEVAGLQQDSNKTTTRITVSASVDRIRLDGWHYR
jgi:hypothetical protein